MAKFKTLDLSLQKLEAVRQGPNQYINNLTMIDWDDGIVHQFIIPLPFPIVAMPNMKIRIQTSDLVDSSEDES